MRLVQLRGKKSFGYAFPFARNAFNLPRRSAMI